LLRGFLLAISLILASCSSATIKGDVISIWRDELTIKQDDGSLAEVKVDNRQDVRILDTVIIKGNKAVVEDRLMEDNFCVSRSCNF
jgi:hypothetical protein